VSVLVKMKSKFLVCSNGEADEWDLLSFYLSGVWEKQVGAASGMWVSFEAVSNFVDEYKKEKGVSRVAVAVGSPQG
jgi:hypothetical protein